MHLYWAHMLGMPTAESSSPGVSVCDRGHCWEVGLYCPTLPARKERSSIRAFRRMDGVMSWHGGRHGGLPVFQTLLMRFGVAKNSWLAGLMDCGLRYCVCMAR